MTAPSVFQRVICHERKIRRLCYVSGQPVIMDGESLYLSDYSFRIVHYPTTYFSVATLVAPVAPLSAQRDPSNGVAISKLGDISVRFLPASSLRPLRWLRQWSVLWDSISNADLVCVNIPDESGFLAAVISRVRRKPLLVQVLGDWRLAILFAGPRGVIRTIKSWFGEWMTRVTVRAAELVFAQGQALFEKCASINCAATQSAIAHSTVTNETFFEGNPTTGFHEPLRILTVGRLGPGKGLEILARAIQNLVATGLRLEWWCIGEGPSGRSLKDLTEALNVSGFVKFRGYIQHGPDLFQLYRQADIFVLPSFHEGVPNVILEAMAQSMPIVATNVGGLSTLIANGIDGILVPPGDPQLLAEAITQVARDCRAAKEMGRAAYQKAQEYRAGVCSQTHRSLIEACFGTIDVAKPCASGPCSMKGLHIRLRRNATSNLR
jgi:glycosyltransferase involved in cell wall biosynthesis